MKKTILILMIIAIVFPSIGLMAQEKNDTIAKKSKKEKPVPLTPYHWNVIKFNPTPMLLLGQVRNVTITYERLIKKDQSLSLQLGYLLFPKLIDDTIASLIAITGRHREGVNISFDYRYYPCSRNRRPAPDGLYIGGYLSYYGFKWDNKIDVLSTTDDQSGSMNGRVNALNLGFELGYQFIFWKRLSLDLLMFGPSLSLFAGTLTINGNLDEDQIQNIDQELVDKLINKYPALGTLFDTGTLEFTGQRARFGTCFRYSFQLGFHF